MAHELRFRLILVALGGCALSLAACGQSASERAGSSGAPSLGGASASSGTGGNVLPGTGGSEVAGTGGRAAAGAGGKAQAGDAGRGQAAAGGGASGLGGGGVAAGGSASGAGGHAGAGAPVGGGGGGGGTPMGGAVGGDAGTGGSAGVCPDDTNTCPDLGTCVLQKTDTGCMRICSVGIVPLKSQADVARLAEAQCNVLEGGIEVGDGVSSFVGLESIHTITGSLDLAQYGSFTDLSGLESLETAGSIFIVVSPMLEIARLPALRSVGGELQIGYSQYLEEIDLPALESVGTLLNIAFDDVLVTMHSLPSLTDVPQVDLFGNPLLPQCEVDAILERTGAGCSISCGSNGGTGDCK